VESTGIGLSELAGSGRESFTLRVTLQDALSHGLNIKWVAEYCGTSVAMIEKHYGRYIKSDSEEQL